MEGKQKPENNFHRENIWQTKPRFIFGVKGWLFYYYLFVSWQHVETWIRAFGRALLWLLLYTSNGALPVRAWLESC